MSAREEYDILRGRAFAFLQNAKRLLQEGVYDLSCFSSEQATQLYAKAALLKTIGDYPRTHSIVELLNSISEAKGRSVKRFLSSHLEKVRLLESTYITSRYTATKFNKDDAERLILVAEQVFKLIDSLERHEAKG